MSAVVGLLNESLTEALKSFYKLRKAYLTLEGVMDAERKFLNERSSSSLNSVGSRPSSKTGSIRSAGGSTLRNSKPPSVGASAASSSLNLQQQAQKEATAQPKKADDNDDDDDDDFVDATEDVTGTSTPQEYAGHIKVPVAQGGSIELDNAQKKVDIEASSAPGLPAGNNVPTTTVPEAIESFEQLVLNEPSDPEREISNFTDHPIDEFIISGANFCFGVLLLLISMVPPSFVSLLKVVGFKGDKERGLRMLWQATKYHNIHGAMAGVVLMGFYNGFVGLCDILPSSGEGSIPKARCIALLVEMRKRYPKSHLWLLEEGRMLAGNKELEKAIQFVEDMGESPFKQLEALSWFERSLTNMSMHDYKATAAAFEKCVTLNNWNHGLYYFICGASYVELYRRNKTSDAVLAKEYAAKAQEYYDKVMPNTGKKRFMGRQLPFDVFMTRKMQKWESRAKEWGCDLIDAIGVSPLEEMVYFWNGYKRMRDDHLQVSLESLAWSSSPANPHWEKEDLDEKAISAVLRAAAFRNMGRTAEAKEILQKEVIVHDNALFTGNLKDSWTAPVARYEMAANLWREADADGQPASHQDLLAQCKQWLEAVSGWGGYDLDARYVSPLCLAKAGVSQSTNRCVLQNRTKGDCRQDNAEAVRRHRAVSDGHRLQDITCTGGLICDVSEISGQAGGGGRAEGVGVCGQRVHDVAPRVAACAGQRETAG
jgi:tetratricopeptide (TPR) repeat protein